MATPSGTTPEKGKNSQADSNPLPPWFIAILVASVLILWLRDWNGPFGPLETKEWLTKLFTPDRHEELYIITDGPRWDYGEVRTCLPVKEVGENLRQRRPAIQAKDLLACDGLLPVDEYVSFERFAVTFKEKGYEFDMWKCLKTPEGIICE